MISTIPKIAKSLDIQRITPESLSRAKKIVSCLAKHVSYQQLN